MIRRVSLVWKKDGIDSQDLRRLWLGEHAAIARTLDGIRRYEVTLFDEPSADGPDGFAIVEFDDRDSCERAFADPAKRPDLLRTRDQFAARTEVFFGRTYTVLGTE